VANSVQIRLKAEDLDRSLAGGLVVEPCDAKVFASVRVAAVRPVLEFIGGGVAVLNEVVERPLAHVEVSSRYPHPEPRQSPPSPHPQRTRRAGHAHVRKTG
jgi:hypothetical protein